MIKIYSTVVYSLLLNSKLSKAEENILIGIKLRWNNTSMVVRKIFKKEGSYLQLQPWLPNYVFIKTWWIVMVRILHVVNLFLQLALLFPTLSMSLPILLQILEQLHAKCIMSQHRIFKRLYLANIRAWNVYVTPLVLRIKHMNISIANLNNNLSNKWKHS